MHNISQNINSILRQSSRDISLVNRFALRPLLRDVKASTQSLLPCFLLCGSSIDPGVLNRASYTCTPGTFLKENRYEN